MIETRSPLVDYDVLVVGGRCAGAALAGYLADLRSDPVFRPLVGGGTMTSRVVGTLRERFFFRQAAAALGWALVGDARHHKDPLIRWGISEGLVQAKHLASAIAEGGDAALQALALWVPEVLTVTI